MTGYIKINRSLWEDDSFRDAEMSQREAWIWMISAAAWKPTTVERGGSEIDLKRGQLCHSIRFMAKAFGWTDSRAYRFISALKKRNSIETESETGSLVITICNYSKFQDYENETETGGETPTETNKKTIKTNNNIMLEADVSDVFDQIWECWSSKGKQRSKRKDLCRDALKRASRSTPGSEILKAATRYVSETDDQYHQALDRWLAGGRFENWLDHDKPQARTKISADSWRQAITRWIAAGKTGWRDDVFGPAPGRQGYQGPPVESVMGNGGEVVDLWQHQAGSR